MTANGVIPFSREVPYWMRDKCFVCGNQITSGHLPQCQGETTAFSPSAPTGAGIIPAEVDREKIGLLVTLVENWYAEWLLGALEAVGGPASRKRVQTLAADTRDFLNAQALSGETEGGPI